MRRTYHSRLRRALAAPGGSMQSIIVVMNRTLHGRRRAVA